MYRIRRITDGKYFRGAGFTTNPLDADKFTESEVHGFLTTLREDGNKVVPEVIPKIRERRMPPEVYQEIKKMNDIVKLVGSKNGKETDRLGEMGSSVV